MDFESFLIINNYKLHLYSYNGSLKQITELQSVETYVNEKDINGCTPLQLACAQKQLRIANYLIQLGADVNCQDLNLATPLHWAMYNNDYILVNVLIKKGANLYAQDLNGIQPIHLAALKGHVEMIKFLEPGKKWNEIKDNSGITPLHIAAHCGHLDIIKALLETTTQVQCASNSKQSKVCDVNVLDNNDIGPLHLAVASGHIECIKLLVEYGAKTNLADSYGRYPVHWSTVNGILWPEALELNFSDKFKCNPLFLATAYGHNEIVKFLLQNNCFLNLECGQRERYIMLNNIEGPDGIINTYYDELASLPATLHWAAAYCSKNVVERLLNDGANIDQRGIAKNTPLHMAASFGNKDVVELLIDKGAKLNLLDEENSTPIHWSIVHCYVESTKLLLNKGARRERALCWAAASGHLNIIKLLIDNGCNVNEKDEYSRTPLMWAAINGHREIVDYLIDIGADVSDDELLHWCAAHGFLNVVKMLVEEIGEDVNLQDHEFKRTPLGWAIDGDQSETAKYLIRLPQTHIDETELRSFSTRTTIKSDIYVENRLYSLLNLDPTLLTAIRTGNFKHLEFLINAGAIKRHYYNDWTLDVLLSQALLFGHSDIADLILVKDIPKMWDFYHMLARYGSLTLLKKYMKPENVHTLDDFQCTPLFDAIEGSNIPSVKYLIELGADVNHKSKIAKCPLYVAIDKLQYECAKILLENGADINMPMGPYTLSTSVIKAITMANFDMIKFVVDNNGDINAVDSEGKNSLHHALLISDKKKDIRFKVIKYLISLNVNINHRDMNGHTPFCFAIYLQSSPCVYIKPAQVGEDVLEYLVKNGAEIDICPPNGPPLLNIAILTKNLSIMKRLLFYGANVKVNLSALNLCKKKHIPMLKLLLSAGVDFTKYPAEVFKNCDPEIQLFMQWARAYRLNLKQLCRNACRNEHGKDYVKYVKSQGIPYTFLLNYFLYNEL